MMRPNALKSNDRIGHYKSITYRPTDWRTEGNLSTATATFGGRCARELFWCYPWLLCLLHHFCTWNSQFRAFLDATSHLYKRGCPSVGRSVRPSVGPSVTSSVTSFFFTWKMKDFLRKNHWVGQDLMVTGQTASSHLYEKVGWSVGPSVRRYVGLSIGN